MESKPGPLAGRTIVVTRSREQASALSSRLQVLGARVIEIPTIAIVPPRSYEPLDRALLELGSYQWLLVTSANTARVLGERLRAGAIELSYQPRTVAVGSATALALAQQGLRVDLVPHPAVAESIVTAIKDQVRGERVLLVRAEVARDVLPTALQQEGALVTVVDAYRTVLAEGSEALIRSTFGPHSRADERVRPENPAAGTVLDGLTFTSSSTVRNLSTLLEKAGAGWPREAKFFSIGPITSSTLRDYGIEPDLEAVRHDVEGLIAVVMQAFADPAKPL